MALPEARFGRLKKSDVIDGAIEYIATKTIADNARIVRVPLNATALAIIEKYKDYDKTKLLPSSRGRSTMTISRSC